MHNVSLLFFYFSPARILASCTWSKDDVCNVICVSFFLPPHPVSCSSLLHFILLPTTGRRQTENTHANNNNNTQQASIAPQPAIPAGLGKNVLEEQKAYFEAQIEDKKHLKRAQAEQGKGTTALEGQRVSHHHLSLPKKKKNSIVEDDEANCH